MAIEIHSPEEIRGYSKEQLQKLSEELREEILQTVSQNGGHLASNLGIVELTIAIHRVFHSPEDSIIFDVGHQCYAHKLLTGRGKDFSTLRQFGGMSGFTNPRESEHDFVVAGHSGPSISAAIGAAEANLLSGSEDYVVAVVGDGSFTNGMIYEALNNCDKENLRLIVILNDNEMSISQNVGGLSRYFTGIRTSRRYFAAKHRVKNAFQKIPGGKGLIRMARSIKSFVKRILVQKNLFECFGLNYIGPVDGHDIQKLEDVLREAKTKPGICLVHAITKKGKGYAPAEQSPEHYHGVSAFDLAEGVKPSEKTTFSSNFGEIMCELAEQDEKLCVITAAMCEGTGLGGFRERFPERFFDVGIAEEYAVAFAGGLSKKGYHPVCVLYSTFSQRVFDQMLHDIALQRLPMILALDRSGLVPGDGVTHQGIFDVSLFSAIPGVSIYAPESYAEQRESFARALREKEIAVIRYAKGSEQTFARDAFRVEEDYDVRGGGGRGAIVTYGRLTARIAEAAAKETTIIKLKKLAPLDLPLLMRELGEAERILIVEEGIRRGGIGEEIASECAKFGKQAEILALNEIPQHGDIPSLDGMFGFDVDSLKEKLREMSL